MKKSYRTLAPLCAVLLAIAATGCDSPQSGSGPAPAAGGGAPPFKVDGPCSESLAIGQWDNLLLFDTLTFSGDCTYTSSACDARGTVASLTSASGGTEFTVESTDAVEGCLSEGSHQCQYEIYPDPEGGTRADLSCDGNATVTYKKRD